MFLGFYIYYFLIKSEWKIILLYNIFEYFYDEMKWHENATCITVILMI